MANNNNINRSLTGINPLSYMGINASASLSAPQMVTQNRAPTVNDSKNFIIGCLWLKPDISSPAEDAEIWMLTSLIGNLATWTPLATTSAGSISIIEGDSGFVGGPTVSIKGNSTAGATVNFIGDNATAMTFNVTDADENTLIGLSSGNGTLTGVQNTSLGKGTLFNLTSGQENTVVGLNSGLSIQSGNDNTIVGSGAGAQFETGNNNILIGNAAGDNLAAAESNNIIIGSLGTLGDSAKIRIGTQGTQTATHIVGIDGVNVGSVAEVVTMSAAGNQLGTAVITAGSGISVTPGANTITIAATGGFSGTASFLAQAQDAETESPGAGVPVTILWGTKGASGLPYVEYFDNGNNFYPGDGVSAPATFTAPATGVYLFTSSSSSSGGTTGGTVVVFTPARNYQYTTGTSSGFSAITSNTTIADLTIGDVVTFGTQAVTGGGGSFTLGGNMIGGYRIA